MKFFFLLVFDILFAFDEPSSVFPARISILLLLREVVVDLKQSGDDGALILLEEEEEETARALLASFDESENEEDEGAINARIVCVFMCMYVYIICA